MANDLSGLKQAFIPPRGPVESLAYINPREAAMLRAKGGKGQPERGSDGIPSFWTDRGDNAGPSGHGFGPGSGPSRGWMGAGYNPNAGHMFNMTPAQQYAASGGSTQYEHPGAARGNMGVSSGGGGVSSGSPSQGPSRVLPNPANILPRPVISPVAAPPLYQQEPAWPNFMDLPYVDPNAQPAVPPSLTGGGNVTPTSGPPSDGGYGWKQQDRMGDPNDNPNGWNNGWNGGYGHTGGTDPGAQDNMGPNRMMAPQPKPPQTRFPINPGVARSGGQPQVGQPQPHPLAPLFQALMSHGGQFGGFGK